MEIGDVRTQATLPVVASIQSIFLTFIQFETEPATISQQIRESSTSVTSDKYIYS